AERFVPIGLLVPERLALAIGFLVAERFAFACWLTGPIRPGRADRRTAVIAGRLVVGVHPPTCRAARPLGFVFFRSAAIVLEVNAARPHRTVIVTERAAVIGATTRIKAPTAGATTTR